MGLVGTNQEFGARADTIAIFDVEIVNVALSISDTHYLRVGTLGLQFTGSAQTANSKIKL